MNQNNMNRDKNEIDLKETFRAIYDYRYMIIFIVIIFTLAAVVHVYFKPNIYQASSTVEIDSDKIAGSGQEDLLSTAMDSRSINLVTDIEVVKSVSLAKKALKKVDMSHHYYTTRKYKQVELYKDSPFRVGMLKGYGLKFNLIPINKKQYRLSVEERKDKNNNVWSYDKVHDYSKEIVTDRFHLNVIKTKEMRDETYYFTIINPLNVGRVVQRNVGASQKSRGASILTITYSDNVPLRTQEFTNALANAFVERSIERKTKEAELKLSFIDKQLKRINNNLKGSAVKLEEFKRNSNTLDLSSKATKIMGQMSTFEIELVGIDIKLSMLNTIYEKIKSGKNIESISIDGLDTSIGDMVKSLQKETLSKKLLRQNYTEVYPEVITQSKKIVEIKNLIIVATKSLTQSIKEKQFLLKKSIAKQQKLLNTLPADERAYAELQRKFSVDEKIYSYLLEKQSHNAILKASTVGKNSILDEAFFPTAPIKPKKTLTVLVIMILGLLLGIGLAFLRAALDDKIKSEEDVEYGTSVPLLGFIPNIQDDAGKIKVFLSPKSALTEAFRSLRTNLQFMQKESKSHVISITSTVGSEGKTTIATNLGAIMSMARKKTIILNLDMRKPTLHEKFGLPNIKGMSTILSGNTNLGNVIQHTEYKGLDIITSGPVPPNPSELIQSDLIEKILMKLREVYDVIILDTPPIGLVSDARVLMQFSDTNIYVVRADYSKKVYLRNVNKLSEENIKGLSILINDVNMESGGYGYGYGYGYYEEDKT